MLQMQQGKLEAGQKKEDAKASDYAAKNSVPADYTTWKYSNSSYLPGGSSSSKSSSNNSRLWESMSANGN